MAALDAVLVVDDDEFVLSVVSRMLAKQAARVLTASDGQAARRMLGETRFELVVCDLKMPGLDGIELLRDFAELQAGAALILMSSADAKTLRAAEQLAQARQLRILGSLQKPVTSTALEQLIAHMAEPARAPAAAAAVSGEVSLAELRAGLAADEIEVYMQPKLGLRSGRLAGAEALARWRRPDGRLLLPGAFVPLAERSGLADVLTQQVVRRALAAQQAWRAEGLDIPVSVNLPIDSLDHLDLPEQLSAELARHGTAPDRLILEITESGVLRDLARSLDVVTRLRLRGYRLSIDDFGTGYSSLEQLQRFPFSELKIDRAFVHGAAQDPRRRSIAESSIRLARDLQLKTCAEGVETEADYELMRELGCELVQGYYVARAMPPQELPRWALAREAVLRG
ncbi:EAL domain-containing protein [Stagnimonas aquatica]|uniref:EAL domain-containing protein n=1 Tax=Stagnimonas aquatica TaxID=2689987 RepID=A0A3N0VLK5_9GAMM|nr:EAL domain-containing response regulator [Stagnimonas aquatica]ROH93632.1 EAL domain-containing protein [Stagnimonas aquatica]